MAEVFSDHSQSLLLHARILPQSFLRQLLPLQALLTINLVVTRAEVYVKLKIHIAVSSAMTLYCLVSEECTAFMFGV